MYVFYTHQVFNDNQYICVCQIERLMHLYTRLVFGKENYNSGIILMSFVC